MNFIFAEFWEVIYVGRKERQRKKTFVIGGYKSFLDSVKKNGSINRLATFIIVDGDRAKNISEL